MDEKETTARNIVEKMLAGDAFSRWLGIELVSVSMGSVTIKMTVREEMLNGFNICHGGIPFSLADSALAFAANTHGRLAVSTENSIVYPAPINSGDEMIAVATELSVSERIGTYDVRITKANKALVGIFRGTVYRTKKEFMGNR